MKTLGHAEVYRYTKYLAKRPGEFRGRVVAANGKILMVTSEGYKRRRSCVNAMRKSVTIMAISRLEK